MAKKKRRRLNVKKLLSCILCIVIAISLVVIAIDKLIGTQYNIGTEIPKDIRTAEDLQDDVLNILICGIDVNEDRTSKNTDVIMYVTMDIKANKVAAFQIPRDTYIGYDVSPSGKINSVYGNNGSDEPVMDLIKVINQKLKLPVDHYVTLDMDAFIAMVDGIEGGLDMYIPCPIILKGENGGADVPLFAEAGWQKINGTTAEQVVRNRNYPDSDVQRLEVQSYFYAALIKNFTEQLNVSDFIKIMNRFTQYITTDLHWTKIASMAQFGFSVDYANMKIVKPSTHGYLYEVSSGNLAIVLAVEEEWARLLNEDFRPYQEQVSASELEFEQWNNGTMIRDYGSPATTVQTIADIMNNSPAN